MIPLRNGFTPSSLLRRGIFCFALCPIVDAPSWSYYRLNDRALAEQDPDCIIRSQETFNTHPQLDWLRHKSPAQRDSDLSSLANQKNRLIQLQTFPNPKAFEEVTQLFLRSRLDITAEDPDVFERAVHVLRQHVTAFPEAWDVFRQSRLSYLVISHIKEHAMHRWGPQLPSQEKNHLIDHPIDVNHPAVSRLAKDIELAWQRDGLQWLDAWHSEGGAMGVQLIRLGVWYWIQDQEETTQLNSLLRSSFGLNSPPKLELKSPPSIDPNGLAIGPSAHVLTTFPTKPIWPRLTLGTLATLLLIGLVVKSAHPLIKKTAQTLLLVYLLFTGIETALKILKIQSNAERQPLFSFQDWQYQIFSPDQPHTLLRSQGGPSRYQWIDTEKPVEFQVGIVGASSAHGSNLLFEQTFGQIIEGRLQQSFPNTSIQVLNGAIGGTTSNGVLHAGQELIQHGIDVLIIYYGHNEAAQFSNLPQLTHVNIPLLRLRLWLSQSRIYSVLFRLFRPEGALQLVPESITPPAQLSLTNVQTLRRLAAENMRYNLQQLIDTAQSRKIPIVLLNPSFHFPFIQAEPFEDIQSSRTAVEQLEAAIQQPTDLRLAQAALQSTTEGSSTDHHARWHFIEALRENGQGKASQAEVYALLDVAHSITTITRDLRRLNRQLAEENGLTYLDIEELFYSASQDDFTVNGLFWDELHPSAEGHQRIAEALWPYCLTVADEAIQQPSNRH